MRSTLCSSRVSPRPRSLENFRFFTNDFDTTTEGFDVVATYGLEWGNSTTDLSLAFNNTTTEITDYNPDTRRQHAYPADRERPAGDALEPSGKSLLE